MNNKEFQKKYRTFLLAHIFMIIAKLLYVVVPYLIVLFIGNIFLQNPICSEKTIKIVFGVTIFYLLLCALFVPYFRKKWIKTYLPCKNRSFLQRYIMRYFINYTIIDVGAFVGIIIFLLSGIEIYAYICIVFSAFVSAINGPIKSELETLMQKDSMIN